jgi:hypothetical protein
MTSDPCLAHQSLNAFINRKEEIERIIFLSMKVTAAQSFGISQRKTANMHLL